jgi:DNA polymerase-3 subunit gamma/tau
MEIHMSYITFNRKYRPKIFAAVIGQDYTIKTLLNSIKYNKVGHAYIFAGPKGIGKTTIARIFAKAINCLHSVDGDACNECANCLAINQNQTTDIVELDAASNNGVEDIRNVIDAANFLPTFLSKKIYIIDEAHMLTPGAWNALLKTLEEAPEHVVFIFATTETQKIPATITSRCQHFQFNRLTNQHLSKMLTDISSKENIRIEQNAIDKIVELADGSGRDVLSILEQLATYTNNSIDLNSINTVFGLINDEYKINFINLMLRRDTVEVIKLINQYEEKGVDFLHLANDLITILIDKLVYLQTNNLQILKKLNANNVNVVDINTDDLIILLNTWQEFYLKIKNANDAKFYFEMATFASFKINSKKQQTTIIEPEIIKSNNAKVSTVKSDTLPSINEVFSYTEHKIIIQKPIVIEKIQPIKKIEPTPNVTINDLFLQIAYNFTNPA